MSDAWYDIIIMPSANDRMSEHFEFLAQVSEAAVFIANSLCRNSASCCGFS